jgi:hypothetical protein
VTVDSADPYELARFWSGATGWPLSDEDQPGDDEVERLLGLGATLHEDHRTPEGSGWVTLTDPEGNEFCIERSDAERAG